MTRGVDRAAAEKSWATRLLERRQALGLTQTQVAELAGVTQQAVSSFERGRTVPRMRTLDRLAAAVGTTVTELFPMASRPR